MLKPASFFGNFERRLYDKNGIFPAGNAAGRGGFGIGTIGGLGMWSARDWWPKGINSGGFGRSKGQEEAEENALWAGLAGI